MTGRDARIPLLVLCTLAGSACAHPGRGDLVARAAKLFGEVIARGGSGVVISSQSGHRRCGRRHRRHDSGFE